MPSGNSTSLMRYCRFACSPRTCKSPFAAESCATPGARRMTSLNGALAPCDKVSICSWLKVCAVAPRSGMIWSRALSSLPTTVMLPSWVTLVELPDASAFAAATLFVCASAVPPQESATDEITDKYNSAITILFSFSLNFFIKFNGLKFSNTLPRIFQDSHFEKHHTAHAKIWFNGNGFRWLEPHRPKPTNQETAGRAGGPRPGKRFLSAGMKTENSVRWAISIQVTGKTAGSVARHGFNFPVRDGDDGAIVIIFGNCSAVQPRVQRRADFRRRHEQPQRERQNPRREKNSFARAAVELEFFGAHSGL